jgi:hypothetical protein
VQTLIVPFLGGDIEDDGVHASCFVLLLALFAEAL